MNFQPPVFLIPARESRAETRVVNSRFIATLAPAASVEEAKAFIAWVRSEYADASHNVPAFIIGHGASLITHAHDDGEPSGTAGRPALAVLQGSGLGDAVVVVSRYFGGTKLGTGRLVRAYGDAVRAVLAITMRAVRVPIHTVIVAVPYPISERLRFLVAAHQGEIIDQAFGTDVSVTASFAVERFPAFQEALKDLSHGAIQAEIVETASVLKILPPE